jgi:hypothetical protein
VPTLAAAVGSELRPSKRFQRPLPLASVGGGRTAELQNANGVVLKVSGPEIGLEASLSLSGDDDIYAAVVSNSTRVRYARVRRP